jgi:hypothetical protein
MYSNDDKFFRNTACIAWQRGSAMQYCLDLVSFQLDRSIFRGPPVENPLLLMVIELAQYARVHDITPHIKIRPLANRRGSSLKPGDVTRLVILKYFIKKLRSR